MSEQASTYRNITYRLLPGSRAKAQRLAGLAGACRFVWNAILAEQNAAYKKAKEAGEKPPSVSFFSLRGFFKGIRAHPRFHSRHGSTLSFTILYGVKVRDGKLHIPKVGYMELRRRGGNPYPDGSPAKAVVRKKVGKWYAVICYRIEKPEIADTGVAAGVDRNCRQVATVSLKCFSLLFGITSRSILLSLASIFLPSS